VRISAANARFWIQARAAEDYPTQANCGLEWATLIFSSGSIKR
jgi:hypothetical protein